MVHARPAVQVVEGSGNTVDAVNGHAHVNGVNGARSAGLHLRGGGEDAAHKRAAKTLSDSAQPPFPVSASAPFHDSLQYHFFFPG